MAGKVYKVELTQEAYQSCREKPSAKLLLVILEMKPGDILEIEGEEFYYSSKKVKMILEESNLEVSNYESDGIYYRLVAEKKR